MKKNKEIMDTSITVKMTKRQKRRLERKAKKIGKSLSDYARECIFEKKESKKTVCASMECVAIAQEIINHVKEKYISEEDIRLKELEERLWKSLY